MPPTEPSDALLVVRSQLGDQHALEQLVGRWQPRLWRFIVRMVSDQGAAEDVLQSVWLQVVRSLVRLHDAEQFAAWIYRIARGKIADRFRRQYRQPPRDALEDVPTFDEGAERLALTEFVEAGLQQLHPTDREAVVLYYFEELPLAEVAAICGVPAGTVKSRLHRARKVLRHALRD